MAKRRIARVFLIGLLLILAGFPIRAQTPPPQRVYGSTLTPGVAPPPSSLVALAKNSQTGALTLLQNSPFNERLEGGALAIDGQGKFLFVLNPNSDDISMFQIDQASGALAEVPGSPFAVPALSIIPGTPPPSAPLSIAAEPSGRFLFVGYLFAEAVNQARSAVVSLVIDVSGASPALRSVDAVFIQSGAPIRLLTDSTGRRLYVGLGIGSDGVWVGGAEVYSIDSAGHLSFQGNAATPFLSFGTDYAIDPRDRFFYGMGGTARFIVSCQISPVDGTAANCAPMQSIGFQSPAGQMLIENSGHYLYLGGAPSGGMGIFSIDQTSGVPTQVGTAPAVPVVGSAMVADPLGPYLYVAENAIPGGVHAFGVNPSTGALTEISGSPFSSGIVCCTSLAISGSLPPAVIGPGAAVFPPSAAPFNATVGQNSAAQMFSLVNTGNQPLSLSAISIVGTNAASFLESNTCGVSLDPNANCSVSVTFSPASAGTFTAELRVEDNAANSPQKVDLTGTGVAPAPSSSFSPNPLGFGDIAQGATEGPLAVTVTNDGTGALHVASVAFAGPNPNDFSQTNNCVGTPVAINGMCTIQVSFTPIAPGGRTATLVVADDALGSPHSVSLQGTATAPFQMGPSSSSGGTSATIAAGQTAQYALQLSPGNGFTGTVALTCSGAPTAAKCTVSPASLSITSGSAAPFSVNVSTTGSAGASMLVRVKRLDNWRFYSMIAACLVLLLAVRTSAGNRGLRQRSHGIAVTAMVVFFLVSGCGGGSTPPPSPVTPRGTYIITVTATSGSLPPQTIPLTLKVD